MAGEELQTVRLRDDFYRDGFYKILFSLFAILLAIALLVAISAYLYLAKPHPVNFSTDNEWRVIPTVALDQPYLKTPDLIQWVSDVLPQSFTFDFVNYAKQLQNSSKNFTPNGWTQFLTLVNQFANEDIVQKNKYFINTYPAGAPFILNQGLLKGAYGWWVQIPLTFNYITVIRRTSQDAIFQVLITRVPTTNNLEGVAIENIVLLKGGGAQPQKR